VCRQPTELPLRQSTQLQLLLLSCQTAASCLRVPIGAGERERGTKMRSAATEATTFKYSIIVWQSNFAHTKITT
jgi:hypothetical protein